MPVVDILVGLSGLVSPDAAPYLLGLPDVVAGGPSVCAEVVTDTSAAPFLPFFLGPLAAVFTYVMIYRFYRNTDKRHHFEVETKVEATDFRVIDRKVGTIRRTQNRYTRGRNHADHLMRVQRINLGEQPGDPATAARLAEQLRRQAR